MAIRTTAAAVRAILGKDYDNVNAPSLSPYIETASSTVDDLIINAAADDITIGSTKAELIERWLSAHDYCLSDRIYTSRSELGASGSFAFQAGKGLDATPYGQRAKALDPSGWLAAMYDGSVASVAWMGKPENEKLDYYDRNGISGA